MGILDTGTSCALREGSFHSSNHVLDFYLLTHHHRSPFRPHRLLTWLLSAQLGVHGAYVYWWCTLVILRPTFPAQCSPAYSVHQSLQQATHHTRCVSSAFSLLQPHSSYPSPTSTLSTLFYPTLSLLVSQAENKSVIPAFCLSDLLFKAKPRSLLTIFTVHLIPDLEH